MQVKSGMTREIESISPDATIIDAARKMRDRDIGALPVCEGEHVIGMITDRDITVRLTAEKKDPEKTTVREVMTSEIEFAFDDEQVEEIAEKMKAKKIRRMPIVDHEERVVGILSLGDLATRGNHQSACEVLKFVSSPS